MGKSATLDPYQRQGGLSSEDARRLQDRLEAFTDQFRENKLLAGILLEGVDLENSSSNKVPHKLGRTPVGAILVKGSAGHPVTMTDATSKTITLSCGAAQTATLWVF